MRRNLLPIVALTICCVALGLEFEDEVGSHGWHDADDILRLFDPLESKSSSRREGVESSEETDNKEVSESGFDVVSGTIDGTRNSESDSTYHNRPIDPFLSPFFNVFNLGHGSFFSGFDIPRSIPWWKGPNVCTERKEEISDWNTSTEEINSNDQSTELRTSSTATSNIGFHFSFNTCVEKPNKRICKTVVDENGRKKTLSVTQQCCRGYGRRKNSTSENIFMPCEELHLRSLIETSERLNGREFIRSAQKNDIDDELRKNITLFLPMDSAFTEFAEQLLESNLVVLPDSRIRRQADLSGITTKAIIMNHIVPEIVNMDEIENEQLLVSAFENRTIRMNVFPRPPGTQSENPYQYTANCAPISKINQEAENGMVHVVDRVLMPVTKTLMEIIRERSDMAVLQTVLDKTDLAKQLQSANKQFTLFAPTDTAFDKLDQSVRRAIKEGKGCALNILKNHILDMTFCSVAVAEGAKTTTINMMGERISMEKVSMPKETESKSEAADLADTKIIQVNGASHITENDIMAKNGVMHVIDTVMPTTSSFPLSAMLEKRNLTVFKTLLQLNGLDDIVDSYENVSIFAPTDSALESSQWFMKMQSEPDSLKNNGELTKFLQYHIAKPLTKTCDLTERSLDTESGDKVRINLYSTHSLFSNIFNRATVNCARLVHFDDDTCGSVLHQIDRPLEAPTQNLMALLRSNEQYSMFAELIESANLTSLLENENRSLTVLVPKNDVFTEVAAYFEELAKDPNNDRMKNIIEAHIIDDSLCCAGIVQSEWPFIRFVKTINNIDLKLNRDRRPKIQNAGVTKCDIIATNGIIQEINDVINPKPQQRTSSRPQSNEESFYPNLKRPFHEFFKFY